VEKLSTTTTTGSVDIPSSQLAVGKKNNRLFLFNLFLIINLSSFS